MSRSIIALSDSEDDDFCRSTSYHAIPTNSLREEPTQPEPNVPGSSRLPTLDPKTDATSHHFLFSSDMQTGLTNQPRESNSYSNPMRPSSSSMRSADLLKVRNPNIILPEPRTSTINKQCITNVVDDDLQMALAMSASMSTNNHTLSPILELDLRTGTFKYPTSPKTKRNSKTKVTNTTSILDVEQAKDLAQAQALNSLYATSPQVRPHYPPLPPSRIKNVVKNQPLWSTACPLTSKSNTWTSSRPDDIEIGSSDSNDECSVVNVNPECLTRPPDSALNIIPPLVEKSTNLPLFPSTIDLYSKNHASCSQSRDQLSLSDLHVQFITKSPLWSLFDMSSIKDPARITEFRTSLENRLKGLWHDAINELAINSRDGILAADSSIFSHPCQYPGHESQSKPPYNTTLQAQSLIETRPISNHPSKEDTSESVHQIPSRPSSFKEHVDSSAPSVSDIPATNIQTVHVSDPSEYHKMRVIDLKVAFY